MDRVGHPRDPLGSQSVRKLPSSEDNDGSKAINSPAEQELQESELKYRTLVESLPHGIMIIEDGKIVFANETMAELLGSNQAEFLIGRDPFEFVADSERDRVRDYSQRRIAREPGVPEHYETVALNFNGNEIPVEVQIKTLDLRDRTASLLVLTDLTERRRSETQLRLLAGALEHMAEGMAVVDPENRLLFVNRYFAVMHGYRQEELIGKHLAILYPPEEFMSLAASNEETLRVGASRGELIHRRKDGAELPVYQASSLLRDGRGSPIGTILAVRDVSEFKAAEQIAVHSLEKSRQQIQSLEDQLRAMAGQLEDSQMEQKDRAKLLEQANDALKVVISEIGNRNRRLEQDVYRKLSTGILPIIDQLKAERSSESARILLDMLEFNLKSLFAEPAKALPLEMMRLTPQETRVCELLHSGLTSKQIADAMSISSATVAFHRGSIRKKLGLVGSDKSLITYLKTKL
jgi:PAS domain S-box-containing protein